MDSFLLALFLFMTISLAGQCYKVRVEGLVEKVSTYESEKYFHSDPHGSQIGEIVSNQEFDSQTQILRRMQDETGSL